MGFLAVKWIWFLFHPSSFTLKSTYWLTVNMTSWSHRAWGFLSIPSWKKCMLFHCLEGVFELYYRLRQPVFWEKKCKSNAYTKSGLNNWISGEGQRGRRKWSCVFVCLCAVKVGWRQSEQQKSSQNCTTVPWSPDPQLPHLHKPHLMPAGTIGAGLSAIDEQEQTDALCSCCPFADSIPGGRKT